MEKSRNRPWTGEKTMMLWIIGKNLELTLKLWGNIRDFTAQWGKTEDWTRKLWKIKDFILTCVRKKLRNDPKCWAILASRWPWKLSTAQHPQILSQALAAQDWHPKTTVSLFYWLVVLTILKNSQWEGLSHILWKIKNVRNHQPVLGFRGACTDRLI